MADREQLEQEQRMTFRVVVTDKAGVDAWLLLAGRRLPARVGDVGAEGMFLTLERGPIAALRVGTKVAVEVSFDDDKFILLGVIRSQHDRGYGLYFPERDALGRPNPLTRFGRIWAQLQRTSLSQRLKVLRLPE